ncbi:MAG: DNA polymerase III subunit alpha [Weeksellaceae bacterium]
MLLNCHTYYSLRFGTFSEEELLALAMEYGYKTIALTDVNNTSAALNFIRLAQKEGIKPIVGIDFRNGIDQQFVAIAKNNAGYMEINRCLSAFLHTQTEIPAEAPDFENAAIIYPFEKVQMLEKTIFKPHEYIGVRWQELQKLKFSKLKEYQDKIVVLQPFTFRNKKDYNTHRLLRAIDNNILLSKLTEFEQASPTEVLIPCDQLKEKFTDFPFIIYNTEKLIEECSIYFDFSPTRPSQNKLLFTDSTTKDFQLLKHLCQEGLSYRYKKITPEIEARIEKELGLIRQMNFVPFFLINWDIIQYAKRKGYYHVGRGSGANSIVAYLLGITDVDPIQLDLYFERFMNAFRKNPPDFDIDFSWRDRDDVTHYIFTKYGQNHQVALLATYNTFQHSAAVRELGKVFGLPKHEIDLLSSGKYNPADLDELSRLTHTYANRLLDMPNYRSVHAGGIIISEKPIHYFSATDLPPKGFPTTHFDMVIAEDVGLFKYDILAQRGLGKIKDAVNLVRKNQPDAPVMDIHQVQPFINDPAINQMISEGDCIGCFYVESPAMRMLLTKLRTNTYEGLVAASSIIRPGVSQSGMMREYIIRHKYPEKRKNAHPVMLEIMPDTYGVMVYQEDVIKVAHYFAGLDLGEADVLRRAMSGKFRSRAEFDKVKDKFFLNCKNKGYELELSEEIWRQISSFAGYAFAKGHSASYAVESYQSLYLKHYYPLEYMVAVLNNGGGYYNRETYVHEARMKGGNVHPPCVNHSRYEATIEGKDIYLGFGFLNDLDERTAIKIIKERQRGGNYISFDDFTKRVSIGIEQLDILIRINAFRFTGIGKRNLLWKANLRNHKNTQAQTPQLFGIEQKNYELPQLMVGELENTFDEIELLGFPLKHPFTLLAQKPSHYMMAKDMPTYHGQMVNMLGYLVKRKVTKTSKGDYMFFGNFLDENGAWIDTVHFPPIAKKFPFRGDGIYYLYGKVVSEFDYISLEIHSMQRLPYIQDPRFQVERTG